MKTHSFIVTVTTKVSITGREVREHVYDAVSGWGGQYDPDDSLFPTEITVKVIHNPARKPCKTSK